MNKKTLVAGSYENIWLNLMILITLGMPALTMYAFFSEPKKGEDSTNLLIVCGLASIVCLGITVAIFKKIQRKRIYITDCGDGFILTTPQTEVKLPDLSIVEMTLQNETKYKGGVPNGLKRWAAIDIAMEGFNTTVDVHYDINNNSPDPLQNFFQRNLNRLTQEAKNNLALGIPLEGENWSLDPLGITLFDQKEEELIPFHELEAVGIAGGKMQIWKVGEELPFIKMLLHTRNMHLLYPILCEQIENHKKNRESPVLADGLGRIIFERKTGIRREVGQMILLFSGIALFAIMILPVIVNLDARTEAFLTIGWVFCLVAFFIPLFYPDKKLQCHELGIRFKKGKKQTDLLYTEVNYFSYGAIRQYHNGVYTGTQLSIQFVPCDPKARNIRFNIHLKHLDEQLDSLRDHISRVMAENLYSLLMQNNSVYWNPKLVFTKTSLQIGYPGSRNVWVLPYEAIINFNIQEGSLYLFTAAKKRSVFSLQTSEWNFFPGYLLFVRIMSSLRQGQSEILEQV